MATQCDCCKKWVSMTWTKRRDYWSTEQRCFDCLSVHDQQAERRKRGWN
jgi:hypothetical protein